jgi:hypothetical protein
VFICGYIVFYENDRQECPLNRVKKHRSLAVAAQ